MKIIRDIEASYTHSLKRRYPFIIHEREKVSINLIIQFKPTI
jgi:hypothetical protein